MRVTVAAPAGVETEAQIAELLGKGARFRRYVEGTKIELLASDGEVVLDLLLNHDERTVTARAVTGCSQENRIALIAATMAARGVLMMLGYDGRQVREPMQLTELD